jgi:hypothetical protein
MDDDRAQHFDESDIATIAHDDTRIFHEWQDWECYPAGFYNDKPPAGMSVTDCEESYREFLADVPRFYTAMFRVIAEWRNSCEHYLTNERMNRIAWLGQSSMCIATGVPSRFCGGYNLLTPEQQHAADCAALNILNIWLMNNGRAALTLDQSQSKTTADLY